MAGRGFRVTAEATLICLPGIIVLDSLNSFAWYEGTSYLMRETQTPRKKLVPTICKYTFLMPDHSMSTWRELVLYLTQLVTYSKGFKIPTCTSPSAHLQHYLLLRTYVVQTPENIN